MIMRTVSCYSAEEVIIAINEKTLQHANIKVRAEVRKWENELVTKKLIDTEAKGNYLISSYQKLWQWITDKEKSC